MCTQSNLLLCQDLRSVTVHASDYAGINGEIKKLHLIAISNGNVIAQQVTDIDLFPHTGHRIRNLRFSSNLMPYVDIVAFYYDARHDPIVDVLRLAVRHECDEAKVRADHAVMT